MTFRPGDWIEAYRGIAQVISVENLYVEEFCLSEGRSIGDIEEYKMVVHKVLCGFDGKLRKRDHYEICTERLCNDLTADSKKILSRIRKSHKKEYDAFLLLRPQRPIGVIYTLGYKVPKEEITRTVSLLQEAIKALPSPFTYNDLRLSCKNVGLGMDSIGETKCGLECNLKISIFNEWCKSRDKQRLFTTAKVKTNEGDP